MVNEFVPLIAIVPFVFYLVLIGLAIYFAIKVINFMNVKTHLDRERNEKLNELIKSLKEEK